MALDKGCFSNAQNQSLYGLGALFPPAIQVFLQWSLIKSVKTKLRVISAPPQLLLQKEGRRPDTKHGKQLSECVYRMPNAFSASHAMMRCCLSWTSEEDYSCFCLSQMAKCEQLALSSAITERLKGGKSLSCVCFKHEEDGEKTGRSTHTRRGITLRHLIFTGATSPSFLVSTFTLKAWLVTLVEAASLPEGCSTIGKHEYSSCE